MPKAKTEATERHGLCAYHVEQTYCPLPGIFCASSAGAGTWYCALHRDNRPQGPGALEDLQRIIDRQTELRAKRRMPAAAGGLLWDPVAKDYTFDQAKTARGRAGLPSITSIRDEVNRGVGDHPEWKRQAGESSMAYGRRMLATMRGHAPIAKRLPYDPHERIDGSGDESDRLTGDEYDRLEREAIQQEGV